ncbi:MAG TPA: alpha/beta hydrolase [Chthoniobacterales bacterium]|jgi:pimeloyl-ACP methyl ester carboxylesterase|nr:alpha/beta hydrolase [Chthoniobacterales bacterium]
MIPTSIFRIWFLGLLSWVLLGVGLYLGHRWYQQAWSYDLNLQRSYFDPHIGYNYQTLLLSVAGCLLFLVLAGGLIVRGILSLLAKAKNPNGVSELPKKSREGATISQIDRPDGSQLRVECYGREGAPPIILTHGWGANSTEWDYLKKELSGEFRLIVWDLPGLGMSTRPANRDYSMENLSRHLEAVLALAGDQPAILLGHSIGGMITLTFCRLFPKELGDRVRAIALVQTTYTNPVRTTNMAGLFTALERPILVPFLHLTIWLSPLIWLSNVMSYLNGSALLSTKSSGFAGTETWEELDFVARFQLQASPAVMARGMLGMLRYDATSVLKSINVPALVVAGDRDSVCKPEASKRMQRDIPGAQLTHLEPAKHMGLIEHHARFAQIVKTFASLCLPSATR